MLELKYLLMVEEYAEVLEAEKEIEPLMEYEMLTTEYKGEAGFGFHK